jgi:hypothetical protein
MAKSPFGTLRCLKRKSKNTAFEKGEVIVLAVTIKGSGRRNKKPADENKHTVFGL